MHDALLNHIIGHKNILFSHSSFNNIILVYLYYVWLCVNLDKLLGFNKIFFLIFFWFICSMKRPQGLCQCLSLVGKVGRSCDLFIYVYITICMILPPSPKRRHIRFSLPTEWDLVGNQMTKQDDNTGNWWSRRTTQFFCTFAMNRTDDCVSSAWPLRPSSPIIMIHIIHIIHRNVAKKFNKRLCL